MRRWELTVALDPIRRQPLFVQLSSAIAEDVRNGRLKPGDPLPGTRELADRLGVTRNTVVAGYQELAAEGLVSSRVGRGTFVSTPPAGPTGAVMPPLPEPTYGLGPPRQSPPVSLPPPRGTLMMSHGVPDPRLLPTLLLEGPAGPEPFTAAPVEELCSIRLPHHLHLGAEDQFGWACDYVNNLDAPLAFGPREDIQEHCNLFAFYTLDRGDADFLPCVIKPGPPPPPSTSPVRSSVAPSNP